MRKSVTLLAALISAVGIGVLPASAINDGELDGNGHPAVVMLVQEVGGRPAGPMHGNAAVAHGGSDRAGTARPTFPAAVPSPGSRVFTEADVDHGDNNFPFAGPNAVEAVSWAAHPLFETGPYVLHDVGVVILQARREWFSRSRSTASSLLRTSSTS